MLPFHLQILCVLASNNMVKEGKWVNPTGVQGDSQGIHLKRWRETTKSISRVVGSQGKVQPTSLQVQVITVETLTHDIFRICRDENRILKPVTTGTVALSRTHFCHCPYTYSNHFLKPEHTNCCNRKFRPFEPSRHVLVQQQKERITSHNY